MGSIYALKNKNLDSNSSLYLSNNSPTLVGTVIELEHSVWKNRVRVLWSVKEKELAEKPDEEPVTETDKTAWLPIIKGVVARIKDRVLLVKPEGFEEYIITGVIDGIYDAPQYVAPTSPSLVVQNDEALTICSSNNKALLTIMKHEDQISIKLFEDNISIELPGKLDMKAHEISLKASKGSVSIAAQDDVVIEGELIKLN